MYNLITDTEPNLDDNQVAAESNHPEQSSHNQPMDDQQSETEPVSLHSVSSPSQFWFQVIGSQFQFIKYKFS